MNMNMNDRYITKMIQIKINIQHKSDLHNLDFHELYTDATIKTMFRKE